MFQSLKKLIKSFFAPRPHEAEKFFKIIAEMDKKADVQEPVSLKNAHKTKSNRVIETLRNNFKGEWAYKKNPIPGWHHLPTNIYIVRKSDKDFFLWWKGAYRGKLGINLQECVETLNKVFNHMSCECATYARVVVLDKLHMMKHHENCQWHLLPKICGDCGSCQACQFRTVI